MRVFEISRMTNRNGPGIRTLVHFKGCPLRCLWCSTPESQDARPELRHVAERCIGCGACAAACPRGAVTVRDGRSEVDRSLCDSCGACAAVCAPRALSVIGRDMTAEEVAAEIRKDEVFFRYSGGGVTFSGGEPLMHVDEEMERLYRLVHGAGISIGVDTTGCVPWENIERLLPYIDFFLWDLKVIDPGLHKELTGAGNRLILDNLRAVEEARDRFGTDVYVRCVQIPGLTDSDENLEAACRLLRGMRCVKEVDLLNYHTLGTNRYLSLGREPPLPGKTGLEPAELERKRGLVAAAGLACRIV